MQNVLTLKNTQMSRRKIYALKYRDLFDWVGILALLILSAEGGFDYIFAGTPLIIWKQLLVFALTAVVFFRVYKYKIGSVLYLSLFFSSILVFSSSILGLGLGSSLKNAFYYISWVPFYYFGLTINRNIAKRVLYSVPYYLIVISGLGLLVQMQTHLLDFLNNTLDAYLYRSEFREAHRLSFLYVTSTIVMPTLIGFLTLLLLFSQRMIKKVVALFFLSISAIMTGSLSGAIMLVGAFGIVGVRIHKLSSFVAIFLVLLFGYFLYLNIGAISPTLEENVNIQMDRITNNGLSSQSNQGRLWQWETAISIISEFSPLEFATGKGLGTTNGGVLGRARLIHGESSYFQAMIEGGMLGLFLRIFPFILLITSSPRKGYLETLVYAAFLFVATAVAPIFGAYGVQCILGFLAGYQRRDD